MRRTPAFLAIISILPFAGSVAAQTKDDIIKLPSGPQPYQALAVVGEAGKITLKTAVYAWQPRTSGDPKTGKFTTTYDAVTSVVSRSLAADQVHAQDVRGNPIASKRLRSLLCEEVPVLVSADGKAVDPLHLRLHRADVIVLLVPTTVPQILPFQPDEAGPPMITPVAPKIEAPELKLEIKGPREGLKDSESTYTIAVANTGAVKALQTRMVVKLSKKLVALGPGLDATHREIQNEIGYLEPGQTRVVDLKVKLQEPGASAIRVTVFADKGTAVAELPVTIVDRLPTIIEKK